MQIIAPRRLAKLALRQFVVRIILQTYIVYILNLRQGAQFFGKFQGIAALNTIARIERFESDGLHISYLSSDIGAKFEEHFSIETLGEIAVIEGVP